MEIKERMRRHYELVLKASEDLMTDVPEIAERILKKARDMVEDPGGSSDADMPLEEILSKLREALRGRVKAAFLFGGRAKGYVLRGDIDVAVLFGRPYDLYELGGLVVDLAEALGVGEELVDLLALDDSPPELVLEALEGIPILVEDPALVFELRLRAMMEYLDLREGMRAFGLGS